VEDVLPTLQQARGPQGNQVAVATSEVVPRPNIASRLVTFYQEVIGEMKKVTWPDRTQIRQLSIGVIVLSLVIGALIALMDLVFQGIFVRALPSLFGG
jgi:preprotein translocase subunit SecE